MKHELLVRTISCLVRVRYLAPESHAPHTPLESRASFLQVLRSMSPARRIMSVEPWPFRGTELRLRPIGPEGQLNTTTILC